MVISSMLSVLISSLRHPERAARINWHRFVSFAMNLLKAGFLEVGFRLAGKFAAAASHK